MPRGPRRHQDRRHCRGNRRHPFRKTLPPPRRPAGPRHLSRHAGPLRSHPRGGFSPERAKSLRRRQELGALLGPPDALETLIFWMHLTNLYIRFSLEPLGSAERSLRRSKDDRVPTLLLRI